MPEVFNRHNNDVPIGAIYVGRSTKWGNPFIAGVHGGRAAVIQRYREWITEGDGRHLLSDLDELRGKDLVCSCAPKQCHADVLLELANA